MSSEVERYSTDGGDLVKYEDYLKLESKLSSCLDAIRAMKAEAAHQSSYHDYIQDWDKFHEIADRALEEPK